MGGFELTSRRFTLRGGQVLIAAFQPVCWVDRSRSPLSATALGCHRRRASNFEPSGSRKSGPPSEQYSDGHPRGTDVS